MAGEKLDPSELVICALILLLAIPAIGPGYGLQYICWFIPLLTLLYGMSGRGDRIFLLAGYGVAAVVYTIAYGFNYTTYGGFFLDVMATRGLLDFGRQIATKPGETWLGLPLWLYYLAFVGHFGVRIARKIKRDFCQATVEPQMEPAMPGFARGEFPSGQAGK